MKPWLLIVAIVAAPVAVVYWICWILAKAEEHVPSPNEEKERSN